MFSLNSFKIKNVANVIIQLKTDAWKTYTDQDTPKTQKKTLNQ